MRQLRHISPLTPEYPACYFVYPSCFHRLLQTWQELDLRLQEQVQD